MSKAALLLLLSFSVLLFCCKQKKEQKNANPIAPKAVEAHGYVVPKDSMAEPVAVPAGKPKVVKAGKPKVVLTNTVVHPAGTPKVVLAGKPRVCTPGQDSFYLPKTVVAIDHPSPACMPEVIVAKDGHVNDNSPYSFISFGEMQGLNNGHIRCMLADRKGNLWIGTSSGGAIRYDGKYFSGFSTNSGLPNNAVLSVMEDNNGNIWFGTFGGGVSKYDGKSFTNYSKKEGLISNNITAIVQSKSGDIWFGSLEEGISMFDGHTFTSYSKKEGKALANVTSMTEDRSGNIWIGTVYNGAFKYDGKTFTNYDREAGIAGNYVTSILQDKQGNVWFSAFGSGVSKYDGQSFVSYTEKDGLTSNAVEYIMEDKLGEIWFCTACGITKFDGKIFENLTRKEGLSDNNVGCALQDMHGNIWLGTENGVCKWDNRHFYHFTQNEGLKSIDDNNIVADKYGGQWIMPRAAAGEGNKNNTIFINDMLLDKNGNKWFGTRSGVFMYDGKSFIHFTSKEGLSNDYITSLLQDTNGNIWFGTFAGGISKYDGKCFTNYTEKEGLPGNYIYCLLQDKKGKIWMGSDNGVGKYDGSSFSRVWSMEKFGKAVVLCMFQDSQQNIWFGTNGDGAFKYDGEFLTHFTQKEGLSDNAVIRILQDKNGYIWFGTLGGVTKYDGKNFEHFTEKEGLCGNRVLGMLRDKMGNLWFGTNNGLSELSQRVLEKINRLSLKKTVGYEQEQQVLFKNYAYEDGFLGIQCTGGMCEDNVGTIWLGTTDRLTFFHPEFFDDDSIPPDIKLKGVQLFGENIPWLDLGHKQDTILTLSNGVQVGSFKFDSLSRWYEIPEGLNLAYNNNYVTFNYIGITTNRPKKVKYKYKLDGIDENWSTLTSSTEAPYANLPSGTYTFRVKARNGDGYWSGEASYTFTIRPPWWKTWWAYTAYVLLVLGGFALYLRWRTASLRARQKALEQTVEERTAEVVAEKKEVEKQKDEAVRQYNRSEELLLNILPSEVAEELKAKGSAEAKTFDDVTVLFTDFKGFTNISERLSAKELVAEIDYCFKGFDGIMEKYNIEKIKTIGDSYMAAGGLPVKNKTHAWDVVEAAIEIRDFMAAHARQRKAEGKEVFEIRIGIHTGPVVAGIVGVKKFAYDIWGDTVNTASRMESSGEPGKVNISAATYELVKDKFDCTYRGKVEAKKKGMIDMYFAERPLPESFARSLS